MLTTSSMPSPYVLIENTDFNLSRTSDETEADYVYIDNNNFDFRPYKPLGSASILEKFVLVKDELHSLFLSHLTKGEDLLNLACINPDFKKALSGYFPKRVKNNPDKLIFQEEFKSTLERDEWSRNRSLTMLYWLTQKVPNFAKTVYEELLALPGYQITLAGQRPNRTAEIAPKMIKACIGCSVTARLFATAAEDYFKKEFQIGQDEWDRILQQHHVVYDSFSTQTEEGQTRFSIAPVYSLWLNYPDTETQIQNAAYLTKLIYSAIVSKNIDYQEQAGETFAGFLLSHPVRRQESVFVQILAMIIAEFRALSVMRRPFGRSFSTVFESTLSEDTRAEDPATLLEQATALSQKITVSYYSWKWKPIQGIARHLDELA